MSFPDVQLPYLPPNTIVPNPVTQTEEFIRYLNRLYEEIAFAVNSKDFDWFTIAVSNIPQDIPNVDNRGAYLISITGTEDGMPSANFSLVKAQKDALGEPPSQIQQQEGSIAPWIGVKLKITYAASTTNFQISHNGTVTGNFNINIMGTL